MKPEELINKQLEYYNQNNLNLFCSTYSDSIEIYDFSTGEIILSGKEALYEKYKHRFEFQKVQTEVKNRIVIGSKVIDYEEVSGIKVEELVKAVAIYEVEDNLISRVGFIFE